MGLSGDKVYWTLRNGERFLANPSILEEAKQHVSVSSNPSAIRSTLLSEYIRQAIASWNEELDRSDLQNHQ